MHVGQAVVLGHDHRVGRIGEGRLGGDAPALEEVEVPQHQGPHVVVAELGGHLERQPVGDPVHGLVLVEHRQRRRSTARRPTTAPTATTPITRISSTASTMITTAIGTGL